ncbi:hypothetical protein HanXRQr2_Chr08g0348361 [Helianthus annuus]|uniref:Uncharacterized protein n=1 Tax=Helianthus annuus TaxID=4232 RepID=A0A9K3NDV1_HELAN|nr:hypothetical protein HanXRQr2_Chr08g0348361 [Helianthus annuus]KAJ0902404.1 hypothetical protein HanPSC8_Chr08g0336621 [Helianthus annuus]
MSLHVLSSPASLTVFLLLQCSVEEVELVFWILQFLKLYNFTFTLDAFSTCKYIK